MVEYPIYNQNYTKLIITEGYTEKLLVNYLKKRFGKPFIYIHIEDVHGGNPHTIISNAIKYSKHRDFQKKYIYIDKDRKIKEEDLKLAQKNNFEFVYNHQCFEATILKLIKPNKDWTKNSQQCKIFFRKIIGPVNNLDQKLESLSDQNLKNNHTISSIIEIIQKR